GLGPTSTYVVTMPCRLGASSSYADEISHFSCYIDKETLMLEVINITDERSTLKLRDINGRIILDESIQLSIGPNKFEFDVSGISPGVYVVEVLSSNNERREKIAVH